MLAIITGTIKPDISVNYLKVRDEQDRLKQYIAGILFLIESKAFSKIVFCENSNYGTEKLTFLREKARKYQIELELISFSGDIEQTKLHGKGYGEGEIMRYVLQHSQLLKDEFYFVKITGRMKVNNINKIVSSMKDEKTYFNIPNLSQRGIYDTRIYAMPLEQFRTFFENNFDKVQDNKGMYLEHVYTQIIEENNIKVTNFPRYPRIIGISGSTGGEYTYTEWKCKIKDVISRLGGYKTKK